MPLPDTQSHFSLPMPPSHIINPISGDDSKVLVRCFDGPMKGRHVWMPRTARTHVFQGATLKGRMSYHPLANSKRSFKSL